MSLSECMESHTNREYEVWMAWLSNQWNEPSRSDHYLMQIAQEVCRVLKKNPNQIQLQQFKIPFVLKKKVVKPDKKVRLAQSKSFWFSLLRLGRPPKDK
jgi:hypothetical protein